MFFILSFLWFIQETKVILFWVYLWQLKEYRLDRFLDHFRTEKGKQLLLNKLLIFKIVLILFFLFQYFNLNALIQLSQINAFIFILLVLYFFESIKALSDFFRGKLKTPILTKKIIFLTSVIIIFTIFYLLSTFQKTPHFLLWLLIFDIFTPAIGSGIVLIFQPLAALARNQIIRKAKEKRAKFKDLLVVGITGSYGKTSTKEFLATILSEKFNVLKTKEHQNTEIGVSQFILNDLKKEHQIFICEMAAYKRGEIKLLGDITKPKIGILTGINEQHLASFGSQENIIKTKYELIESLPEDGLAIFNGSNPHTFRLYLKTKKPKRIYRYQSIANHIEPDIFAKDILTEKESISFRVYPKSEPPLNFKVNVLGGQNVGNILAAILVAKELGMTWEEISKGCQKIKPTKGSMQLKKGINGINVVDSTYSANPDGVIADLDYLKIYSTLTKKIIVMPCLIELGKASKEIHNRIGQRIGKICDLAVITTKERFKEIKEGAMKQGMRGENILFIEDPKQIFERIKIFCGSGDVVLLESRVPNELIKWLIIK